MSNCDKPVNMYTALACYILVLARVWRMFVY